MTDAAGDASQYYFDENGRWSKTSTRWATPVRHLRQQLQPDEHHRAHRADDDVHLRCQWQPDQQHRPAGPDHVLHLRRRRQPPGQRHQRPGRHDQLQLQRQRRPHLDRVSGQLGRDRDLRRLGDPLSLTDPNGQVTSYTYNAAGPGHQRDAGRRLDDDVHLRCRGQPDHRRPTRRAPPRSPTTPGTGSPASPTRRPVARTTPTTPAASAPRWSRSRAPRSPRRSTTRTTRSAS